MKTGIIGGTFDPIHKGHISIAEAAYTEYRLDRLIFMPAGDPYFKSGKNVTPAGLRLEMTRACISAYSERFECSDFEIRDKNTYSSITFSRLKLLYPEEDYYFIMGLDSLISLPKWYKPDLLLKNTVILCASRETDGPSAAEAEELVTRQREYFSEKYSLSADIRLIHTPLVDISSTQIREKVRRNEDISGLVTPETEAFIYKHKLYREQ